MNRLCQCLALLLVLNSLPTRAARLDAADPPADLQSLAPVVRTLLLHHLPTPAVSANHHWGQQKDVVVGFKFHRSGPLRWDSEPQRALRNDGHWTRLTVTARDPASGLALGLENPRPGADGALLFDAKLGAPVDLRFEQQLWKSGVRLYSGETRGRCQAAVALTCEATNKIERKPGELLPTAVLRLRVTKAELFYKDLVVEHTLGVGGDAARILGEVGHDLMNRLKPSLERDLLAKANAAVVKAGDTKEVRVGLDKLLGGK